MKTSNKTPSSCCSKCQELYNSLNHHISNQHSSTQSGSDSVLTNILLNILSLLINSNEKNCETPGKESSFIQNITTPVSSSHQDYHKPVQENKQQQTKQSFKLPKQKLFEDASDFAIAQSFSPFVVNSTSELTPKLAFQPDGLGHIFSGNLMNPHNYHNNTDSEKDKLNNTVTSVSDHKLMNSLDFSNLMIPQSNDFMSVSTAFITPEGNLTPAGISLILANQNKNTSTSGKSDLDVADILVNKMPIPSLNKDPNFLQLSSFYLSQLALNQTGLPANNTIGTQQEVMPHKQQNTAKHQTIEHINNQPQKQTKYNKQQDKNSKDVLYQQGELTDQITASLNATQASFADSSDLSLQQLITRHKQIAGLIDAITDDKKTAITENKKDAPKILRPPTPPLTIQPTVASPFIHHPSNYTFNQMNILNSSVLSVPQLLTTSSIPMDVNTNTTAAIPISISPTSSTFVSTSQQKTGIQNANSSLTGRLVIEPTSCNISSEDIENNKLSTYFNARTTGISTIDFANSSLNTITDINRSTKENLSKKNSQLFSLQNLVIEEPIHEDLDVLNNKQHNDGEYSNDRKHKYSSVTMVPITQYDPLDGNMTTTCESVDDEQMDDDEPSHAIKETKVLYKCDVCSVTFTVLSTLQAHMKTHLGEKEEECSYCKMMFTDHDEFYKHVASHRGEENIFKCQYCPKIFTSKGDFTKHLTKHTQRRPYICSHCEKSFRDPGSLTKHERIHTGEQPYVCETCQRAFAEKSSLRKHLRVHSGEKPYKCEECNKSFSISGNLRRHAYIHSGQRPFKCTFCIKAFNNPSHLRRHIKNLHNKDHNDIKDDVKSNDLVSPRDNNETVSTLPPLIAM